MKIKDKITWKPLGDKVVAVKIETGEYYTMNEVASLIWKGLAAEKNNEEIVDSICEIYDIEDKESVLHDIETQISEWEQENLLTSN